MHKRERKPSRKFEEARADGLWPKSARRPRLCTVVDRLDNANQAIIHQQAQNEEATRQLQDMSDTVYSLQKADSAGWRKKPKDTTFKNFTALVVKVLYDNHQ